MYSSGSTAGICRELLISGFFEQLPLKLKGALNLSTNAWNAILRTSRKYGKSSPTVFVIKTLVRFAFRYLDFKDILGEKMILLLELSGNQLIS